MDISTLLIFVFVALMLAISLAIGDEKREEKE